MWAESERDYASRMVAASRRRDVGESPFTDEDVARTSHLMDELFAKRCRPDVHTHDLSGLAPPIVVDEIGGDDMDELSVRMTAAAVDSSAPPPLATVVQLSLGDPWACAHVRGITAHVRVALNHVAQLLERLRLSGTEFSSAAHLCRVVGAGDVLATADNDTRVLLGVYGAYGVTCLLDPARQNTLVAYAFTVSTKELDRRRAAALESAVAAAAAVSCGTAHT
jgi:hypothetical protein